MRNNRNLLAKELQQAGASEIEIRDLLPIASGLSRLRQDQDVIATSHVGFIRWTSMLKPVVFSLSGLILGALVVITSLTASPTSPLYSLQKLSDSATIHMYPQYRAIVMMKRAQQVNQLVAEHASPAQVLAVLNDYTSEADMYKSSPHADYVAFEFCRTNLQQAASTASPEVRDAIDASLQSLDTI